MSAQDPEKVLRAILSSRQPDRGRKAQAFITTQGLRPETVAELVAEEIMQELLASSEGKGSEEAWSCILAFLVSKCGICVSEKLSLLSRYLSARYGQ